MVAYSLKQRYTVMSMEALLLHTASGRLYTNCVGQKSQMAGHTAPFPRRPKPGGAEPWPRRAACGHLPVATRQLAQAGGGLLRCSSSCACAVWREDCDTKFILLNKKERIWHFYKDAAFPPKICGRKYVFPTRNLVFLLNTGRGGAGM